MFLSKNHGKVTVLQFSQEQKNLTMTIREKIKTELLQFIDLNKYIILILDGIQYIDSSGIGSLVTVYHHSVEKGHIFALCGLNKKTSDLVKITKPDTLFSFYPDTISFINKYN